MHFNYLFLLEFAEQHSQSKTSYAALDYGCGKGEVVSAARQRGTNVLGAEVFYEGGNTRSAVEATGALGSTIREIINGKIDFPDKYFDLVVSNQVLEHVPDLDQVLSEINRVLKPGGVTLHLFLSRDVRREGHSGIPFLHWFSESSRLRYQYALGLRKLGFGYFKEGKSPEKWARDFLIWLDTYCYYRDRQAIVRSFSRHFSVRFVEDEYIRSRLSASRLAYFRPRTRLRLAKPILSEIYRKLSASDLLGTKA